MQVRSCIRMCWLSQSASTLLPLRVNHANTRQLADAICGPRGFLTLDTSRCCGGTATLCDHYYYLKTPSWQVPQYDWSAAAKPDLKSASRSALMDLQSSAHTLHPESCFQPPGSQPWESHINKERQCLMGLHVS